MIAYKEYQRSLDKNNYNWQIPEHMLNKLTLDQLDCLADLNKDTSTDYTFRQVQFLKRFNVNSSNIRENSKN